MKSILITGASGGFGIEFAKQLEETGHKLILHGRDRPRLQLTLDALKYRDRHELITADISNEQGVEFLLKQIETENELMGLVNNAGFGIWGKFEAADINSQRDVLTTDLIAPVLLTHALMPCLIRNHGFIINVSSLAGETPLPFMSIYSAAKAGLTYWSEAMREEMKGQVAVVTLAPGPSPTGFRDVSGLPIDKGGHAAFRDSARTVVCAALTCLEKGGGFCVPGFRHKLLWLIQKITPRSFSLAVMHKSLRP